jgi:hypothetical protein
MAWSSVGRVMQRFRISIHVRVGMGMSFVEGDVFSTSDIIRAIGDLLTSVNKAIRVTDINYSLTGARLTEFR